jgi:chorismate mutase
MGSPATKSLKTTEIMGVRPQSTSKCYKLSASEFIMVLRCYFVHAHKLTRFFFFSTGKFVSESKFIAKPSDFIPHIQNPNRAALDALITKPEVEKALLRRLAKKAAQYAVEFAPDGSPSAERKGSATAMGKEDVEAVIVDMYEHHIIPLTKEVEVGFFFASSLPRNAPIYHRLQVDYLLHRLDGLSEEEIEELRRR